MAGTASALEHLSAPASALLQVLSVLDPDRIPEELLTDGVKKLELPHYPTTKDEYSNARAELIHASFVTNNTTANELRIQRPVQDLVRQRMKETELYAVYAAVVILLNAVWPFVSGTDPSRNQSWRIPVAEKYAKHIRRLEALFGSDIREGKYDGTATSGYVFCSYAWYLSERSLPDQTKIFASLAQIILRKALDAGGGDEEQIVHWLGEAYHNLSLASVRAGSSDGLQDAKVWLDLLLAHTRSRRPSEAEALSLAGVYNQMGICFINNNEIDDAMNSWKQSLAAYRGMESPPRFSETWPAVGLALLYTFQGSLDEGEEVLAPSLEEHERILGKDDKTTTESAHIWRAMANIRNAQKRYREALAYRERALENMKVTLGAKHDFTGDCFYSIGVEWMRQGDAAKARENFDAAIEAFTAAPHREAQTGRAMWKKGCLLKTLGEKLESERLFDTAMKIWHELVPDKDRPVEELNDEDWGGLIIYWSR